MDFLNMFHEQLINLAIVTVTAFTGWATKQLGGYLKKKGVIAELDTHKELVRTVVNGVEQAYSQLHGKEKLNMAKIELIKLSNSKGIKLNESDLDMMIEAVVKEMHDAEQAFVNQPQN